MTHLPLDDRDLQILSVLSREGRISKTELARRVNLSATPAWERMKRLEQAGLIRGYRAEVALARVAAHVVVFVMIELESHRPETFQAFERTVALHDEITAVWAIGGGFDYLHADRHPRHRQLSAAAGRAAGGTVERAALLHLHRHQGREGRAAAARES